MDNNKDKRISWLSIYSSLCEFAKTANGKVTDGTQLDQNMLSDIAYQLNDKLYKKYPLEEENTVKVEETKELCPICGEKKVIKSGEKNGNKWRGLFCSNPECEEKPQWLKVIDFGVEEHKYNQKV